MLEPEEPLFDELLLEPELELLPDAPLPGSPSDSSLAHFALQSEHSSPTGGFEGPDEPEDELHAPWLSPWASWAGQALLLTEMV